MRYLISLLFLIALIVGWQRSGIAQGTSVTGLYERGKDFQLFWPPNIHSSRACIAIPADARLHDSSGKEIEEAEITIGLMSESGHPDYWPRAFQKHHRIDSPPTRRVFPPIINLSAIPHFTMAPGDSFVIGICVVYDKRDMNDIKTNGQVARAASTGSLEFLTRVPDKELCTLSCEPAPQPGSGNATGYLRELFARSPFTATPLYALPHPAEGGLGGKGGSGSPFAVAENKP